MRACLSEAVDEEGTRLTENVGCDQGRGTSLSGIWILTPCSFTIIPRAFDSFNLEKTALEKYSKERRRWSGPRNGPGPRCRGLTAPRPPAPERRPACCSQDSGMHTPASPSSPAHCASARPPPLLGWTTAEGTWRAAERRGGHDAGQAVPPRSSPCSEADAVRPTSWGL